MGSGRESDRGRSAAARPRRLHRQSPSTRRRLRRCRCSLFRDRLPPGVDLIEIGTAGLRIVHELMEGYDALVVVDAIERDAEPGTVFVLSPEIADPAHVGFEAWQAEVSNLHLAEPSRVLLLARAAGVLPTHVALVGCQPESCDGFEEGLSAPVSAAVPIAARRVNDLVHELLQGVAP